MANCNRRSSLYRKCAQLFTLLTMICFLVASHGSALFDIPEESMDILKSQVVMPIDYEDILKSQVSEIQSDINQIGLDPLYFPETVFECYHCPVQFDGSTKIVVFLWASERETHAMRSCLYQEMKSFGNAAARILWSSTLPEVKASVTFCNRSMNTIANSEMRNDVILLNLYFDNPENNDGLIVEEIQAWYRKNGIPTPTATSSITVRSRNYIKHQVRTLVCTSIQLALNKTERLRQRFFSVVENSTEIIIKSTRNVNVSVTLVFDVLVLNRSRLGMLNDSNTETLLLLYLDVSCVKRDQYGLENETNKLVHVNTTKVLSVATKAKMIKEKLRIYVNVSIPHVSDHSFGDYSCYTHCELQIKHSKNKIAGCAQLKYFSIVFDGWRNENMFFKQACKEQENDLTNIKENLTNINKKTNTSFNLLGSIMNMTMIATYALLDSMSEVEYLKNKNSQLVCLVIILTVVIVYIVGRFIYKEIKTRISLKAFISLKTVLQSTENCDHRIMKYDVFLSYSSKDRLWVQSTLLKFIESKGFKVCFDERDFPYGCSLVESIAKAVYESRKVIAVVSPNYLESRWCVQLEFHTTVAKIMDKEAPSNSLLPIKYRNCQMPEYMNCFKYLDYTKVKTTCDGSRNIVMKLLSYWIPLYKKVDAAETFSEIQFFDRLLSWLGKPRNKSSSASSNTSEYHGRNTHNNRTENIRNRGKVSRTKLRK